MTTQHEALVLLTDFGTKDGAVSAMKGVALSVSHTLSIFDLTHEIPPFNIWEGGYRLLQTVQYWRPGTVFVAVIDPGVGTERHSVAVRSSSGHIFVCPDNGLLTLTLERYGIAEVRIIDEQKQRLPGSSASYTFMGRDLYAYVGARLATHQLLFEDVGHQMSQEISQVSNQPLVQLNYQKASLKRTPESIFLLGNIPVLDIQYGNLWTNISGEMLEQLEVHFGDSLEAIIFHHGEQVYQGIFPYAQSFGKVQAGEPVLYVNSLLHVALALNQKSLAQHYQIASGVDWSIRLRKV